MNCFCCSNVFSTFQFTVTRKCKNPFETNANRLIQMDKRLETIFAHLIRFYDFNFDGGAHVYSNQLICMWHNNERCIYRYLKNKINDNEQFNDNECDKKAQLQEEKRQSKNTEENWSIKHLPCHMWTTNNNWIAGKCKRKWKWW